MTPPRSHSNGKSPFINPKYQITSYFSSVTFGSAVSGLKKSTVESESKDENAAYIPSNLAEKDLNPCEISIMNTFQNDKSVGADLEVERKGEKLHDASVKRLHRLRSKLVDDDLISNESICYVEINALEDDINEDELEKKMRGEILEQERKSRFKRLRNF